jgi:predicted nucleic acid-binding protein
MRYVADASVVIKWYVDEVRHERARALLTGADEVTAPDFVLVELANIVWKKTLRGEIDGRMAADLIREAPEKLGQLLPARPLLTRALELALALGHPSYDCLYLAAAEAVEGVVVTDDRRFHDVVLGSALADRIALLGALPP